MFSILKLQAWIKEKSVEEKAYSGFKMNLENYMKEEPNEFSQAFEPFDFDKLEIRISDVSVSYGNYPKFDYNHIVVNIPILYRNKSIGYYKLLLNFDGTPDDDYFVIY